MGKRLINSVKTVHLSSASDGKDAPSPIRSRALALTARQKQIFEFIQSTIEKLGFPPTVREIGHKFGITSTNGVRSILTALLRKGYIRKQPHQSRGIQLVERLQVNSRAVPIIGQIAAGLPITAIENIEGSLAIDKSFLPGEGVFTLKVTGNSMKEAGIFDGDFVLVNPQVAAKAGDIVCAIVVEEATIKKYFPHKNHIRLEPANPDFTPLIVEKNTPGFFIAGKVIGVMRKL